VKFRVLEDYLSVLVRDDLLALVLVLKTVAVPLSQHEQVLKCTLPDHIVRIRNEGHQDLQGRLERDLVVVVDHQVLEEARRLSIQQPFKTAGV